MKKLIANIHWLLLLWGALLGYEKYNEAQISIESKERQITAINLNIKKKKNTLNEVRKYKKDIEFAKESIEVVAQEVERIQKQLPSRDFKSEDLEMMKNLAKSLNMKSINIDPLAEEEKGFYFVRKYQVEGIATFLQYLIFLEKLSEKERIYNVESIIMNKEEGLRRGRFELVKSKMILITYRYNRNFKEDRGIDKIESEFK